MKLRDQLHELQEKIAAQPGLEAKLRELRDQRDVLESRISDLRETMKKEQADVARLEHGNLSAIFYTMVGRKTDRMDRERMEVYAARVKYEAALQELSHVEHDIEEIQSRLGEIAAWGVRYEALRNEKAAAIRKSGSADAAELLKTEEQIAVAAAEHRKIVEAIQAGTRALGTVRSILSSLDSAQGWGTWDLLGGGLLSDLAKHSHLDDAQEKVQRLQEELRCFKTELADVRITAERKVSVDGFLRFADFFFDGLFADWAVMDQVSRSRDRVRRTESEIESVLSRLHSLEEDSRQAAKHLEAERDAVIDGADL